MKSEEVSSDKRISLFDAHYLSDAIHRKTSIVLAIKMSALMDVLLLIPPLILKELLSLGDSYSVVLIALALIIFSVIFPRVLVDIEMHYAKKVQKELEAIVCEKAKYNYVVGKFGEKGKNFADNGFSAEKLTHWVNFQN